MLNLEGQLGEIKSLIVKTQHNCKSDAKTYSRMEEVPIQHEFCVVFQKA